MGKSMLSKGKVVTGISAIGIAFLWCIAIAADFSSAEFSADMHMKSEETEFEGKVYIKGNMQRQEGTRMGQDFVTIIRLDKGVLWNIMTGEKMYMEMAIPEGTQNDPGMQEKAKDIAEIRHLGEETVNGYTCEKYEYVFHDKSRGTMTQWFSKELGYPVKMVHSSGMVIEYRNIKEGNLADSLFEIPAGFTKFTMPGMPGGMPFGR